MILSDICIDAKIYPQAAYLPGNDFDIINFMSKTILSLIFSFALVFPAAAQTTSTPAQNLRQSIRQEVQGLRSATQEQIQKEREDFQQKVQTLRANLQSAIQAHRDDLKAKLQNIKDERKKAAVERIDQNLTELNSRMTTHYTNVLDQISEVLKRIVSRTDKAQANGIDVTSVRTAIANAQAAIDAARAAVTAQVSKVYSLNITTDAALKNNVGAARKALHDDLKKVEDLVKAARTATQQAAITLGQIRGVDELKETTSTATSTNQ